jgi:hypothetical protein
MQGDGKRERCAQVRRCVDVLVHRPTGEITKTGRRAKLPKPADGRNYQNQ